MALDYRWAQAGPPAVVACGRGELAERIVAVAEANGVPVRRDADLVQILSRIDMGTPIPTEAFAAVAEILAYLYRLNSAATPNDTEGAR